MKSIAALCCWTAYPDSDDEANEASPLLSVNSLPAFSYGTIAMDEFRVIVLHPARSFADDIEIHLQTRKRSDCRFYEAVSYTWGTAQSTDALRVHDSKFADVYLHGQSIFTRMFRYYKLSDQANAVLRTRSNVATMLRYLRYKWLPRYLWIDAISINQMNIKEKSQQVNQMGDIYRKSGRTLIWLGSSRSCPRPLSALQAAARTQRVERWAHLSRLMGESDSISHARQKYNTEEDTEVQDVLSLPWFNRRWVCLYMYLTTRNHAYRSRSYKKLS
jgi:hypothetical protein